ncbi:hypothetical protein WN943_010833 [Citrus x changshan-huyou]
MNHQNPEPDRPVLPTRVPLMTNGAQRKIAIAVDLSDESAYAVRWAVENYLRPGDAVVLLHVRQTSVLYGADWGFINNTENRNDDEGGWGGIQLDSTETDLTATTAKNIAEPLEEAGLQYKIHIVKDHDMKERLCLEVERLGLSAMIMGSRGIGIGAVRRSSVGRLGSVSDYCVHHCVCPVVVLRYPDDSRSQHDSRDDAELHSVPEEDDSEYHDFSD